MSNTNFSIMRDSTQIYLCFLFKFLLTNQLSSTHFLISQQFIHPVQHTEDYLTTAKHFHSLHSSKAASYSSALLSCSSAYGEQSSFFISAPFFSLLFYVDRIQTYSMTHKLQWHYSTTLLFYLYICGCVSVQVCVLYTKSLICFSFSHPVHEILVDAT